MEFCSPRNQAEVDGGWCLLLAPDVPVVPEVFPTSFFGEHFYWAAGATLAHGTQTRGVFTTSMEGAFANGPAIPGDQITFARIRMVLTPIPATGTYRIIHPFGEDSVFAEAGGKIFYTQDVAVPCATGFDCPLNGRVGPFLLPSDVPGGAEMPALTAANPAPDKNPAHFGGTFVATPYPGTGSAYIADPARLGPVTGSPLPNFIDSSGASRNHNIIRIEGPAGSGLGGPGIDYLESTDFSLTGRVYTGAMPGQVDVKRASYLRSAAGNQLDVIATAVEASQGRMPAGPRPIQAPPQLSFFDAPCAGAVDPVTGAIIPPFSAPAAATETQMFAASGGHWGQARPTLIPAAVCVKDASARDVIGNLVPTYTPHAVSDEVAITQAIFDPAAGALTVAAASSDTVLPPALTVGFGTFRGSLVNGSLVVPTVAPPANLRVFSSAGGSNKAQVMTGAAAGIPAPTGAPVAVPDSYTFLEDAGPQLLVPLANDLNAAGGTVTLTTAPRLGTAVLNPNGTVTYTSNLNANGTDGFTYTVTAGTKVSNTGTVTLNITPVNDPPVAVNDTASALVNVPVTIDVLANDTDPDGFTDIVAVAGLTPPTPAGATVSLVGRLVTFNATVGGTYSFTYKPQDAAGAVSANTGVVTVKVAAAETFTFTKSEYVVSKGQLIASGSVLPAAGQTVTVQFVDAAGTVLGLAGTVAVDGAGNWSINTLIAKPAGTTALKATTNNGTVKTAPLALK
ncbi:Ig-like domain-containing protein [Azoarcus sp. DN11]|uniref:Ig-like domain-containing protein n=1 Tax=Azoarcus sp. DN11 TaxID=356837 RepID=UPI0013E3CE63|nr:Ig-like domain-containing protein [Azoarcus sp. DN11]